MSSQPNNFVDHFSQLEDPRLDRTKLHPLTTICFLALCATMSGADDFVAIANWGVAHAAWLARFIPLPNGIPSHDTLNRVFALIEPARFLDCFFRWVEPHLDKTKGRFINIDGKTQRASLDKTGGKQALRTVSAWAGEQRLLLGQQPVEPHSNEITAIPKLLEVLELEGALATIDAAGCQQEIVEAIVKGGGDYVLAVKGNQPPLETAVQQCFAEDAKSVSRQVERCFTIDDQHGRTEVRECEIAPASQELKYSSEWRGLKSVVRVTRLTYAAGKRSEEVRYFISSGRFSAAEALRAVRGHWSIENGLIGYWT